jgi:hypothetical protein
MRSTRDVCDTCGWSNGSVSESTVPYMSPSTQDQSAIKAFDSVSKERIERKVPNLLVFPDGGYFGRGGFGVHHQGLELPLRTRLKDRAVIAGRAELLAGGIR